MKLISRRFVVFATSRRWHFRLRSMLIGTSVTDIRSTTTDQAADNVVNVTALRGNLINSSDELPDVNMNSFSCVETETSGNRRWAMDGSIVFARWRQCAPLSSTCSLGPPASTSQTASWSFQPFIGAHNCDRQTDRTGRQTTLLQVCNNRPHVYSTTILHNNSN